MELKENINKVLAVFGADSVFELPNAIYNSLFSKNREHVFREYLKHFPDLKFDFLQLVYQFYLSDRKDKKQDYTPMSLSQLVSAITWHDGEKKVYDCCCGSGSLSIQKWVLNPNTEFYLEELDENVIPFTIFNMCIRNIEGILTRKNIITGDVFESYRIIKGKEFSTVQKEMFPIEEEKCDTCVSNPPFNLTFDIKGEKIDGNIAFVKRCIEMSGRTSALILPGIIINGKKYESFRQELVDSGKLKSVIQLPNNMFECTGVETVILLLDDKKENTDVMLINASEMCTREERKQRGEGANYNRVYTKMFNTFSPEQIIAIVELVNKEQDGFSKIVHYDELSERAFNFNLKVYEEFCFEGTQHRDFNQIIKEINFIIRQKNVVRLNINKKWADELGLNDLFDFQKNQNDLSKSLNESLRGIEGYDFKEFINDEDFINISASKVLCFENKDKEILSNIFTLCLNMYKQYLMSMNDIENELLVELRDSLLPYLMNGKLSVRTD